MERELEELEQDNIQHFLAELEDIRFDLNNNEFDTKECVICMEEFVNGQKLKRIPICRHFFHPNCLEGWFKSKAQEDDQRCPQCNIELKTFKMKEARENNLVSPVPKKGIGLGNKNMVSPQQELSLIHI